MKKTLGSLKVSRPVIGSRHQAAALGRVETKFQIYKTQHHPRASRGRLGEFDRLPPVRNRA